MLVNLSDVLTSANSTESFCADLELEHFKSRLGDFPVVKKEPVSVEAVNTGTGKAHLKVKTSLVLLMSCDRCLKEVEQPFELLFSLDVKAPSDEDTLEWDDREAMEGYQLNIESLISRELLVNWPEKVLCTSDCKGICPVCGKNWNTGTCDCDTFVPDPRMAAIKDIFNVNHKEV